MVTLWRKYTLIWYEPATAFSQVGLTNTRFTFSIGPICSCGMLRVCKELCRLQRSERIVLNMTPLAWKLGPTHPSHAGGRRYHCAAQFRRRTCMELNVLRDEALEVGYFGVG
jgi:hypothetical protein